MSAGTNRKAAPAQTFYEYFIYFPQLRYLDIIIKRYHQFFFPPIESGKKKSNEALWDDSCSEAENAGLCIQ